MHGADEPMAQITAERLVEHLGAIGLRGDLQAGAGPAQLGSERCDQEAVEEQSGRVVPALRARQLDRPAGRGNPTR